MIQQKVPTDSSTLFNRPWADYKAGFGSLTGNYWLGNENVYQLTNAASYMLRIEMLSTNDGWISAEYDMFLLENEILLYEIQLATVFPPVPVGVFYGDAGDSLQWVAPPNSIHGFMPFQTSDRPVPPNTYCPTQYKGGWWYNKQANCIFALLNTDTASDFVLETMPTAPNYDLTVSRMMIQLV